MNHGSLFSGIGGFDLAAKWVGWNNVFQVEKDDWCRKILAKNFIGSERFADIKDFKGDEYTNKIDVISGGFPCQPFSVVGKRKGKEDDRYLWKEMLRVIATIKPAYVVGENVTGIIGLALDTVLSDLEAQDYTTETFIIPACSKNAWHRRDRVWIVAYTNSIGRKNEQKENREPLYNGEWNNKTQEQSGEQQQCRTGKSSTVFPNAENNRCECRTKNNMGNSKQSVKSEQRWNEENGSKPCGCGNISTNPNNPGCEEQRKSITDGAELFAPKCSSWWETESGVGRVVDGLPNRVDRIKALGNAIVPQVALQIFKAIALMEVEMRNCQPGDEVKCGVGKNNI